MLYVARNASLRLVVPLLLTLAACGGGDEATVENIGGTGSATHGGTATGARTGSATHGGQGATATRVAACEPVGDPSTASEKIDVVLDEWSVQAPERVAAGRVTFTAQNAGEEPHELVIVRADDPGALPVDEQGAVDEEKLPPDALVGEIEAFPSGESCQGTFDLPPGEYVLFCNIVEQHEGEQLVHYQLGMRTKLTVGP
ncbi:MAG: hypothetical protein M3N32_10530 [Actinomycetota bacterium]|nr:hypothetical protein [Actinomycetota bacterium]